MDLGVVFAVDDTVYLDGGAAEVKMPEVAQTLYYTSAGLLVRTNKTGRLRRRRAVPLPAGRRRRKATNRWT